MKVKALSFWVVKVSASQICYEGGATSLVEIQAHLKLRGYLGATQNEIKIHMDALIKSALDWQVIYDEGTDFPVYYREF